MTADLGPDTARPTDDVEAPEPDGFFLALPEPAVIYRVLRDASGHMVDLELEHMNESAARSAGLPPGAKAGARIADLFDATFLAPYLPRIAEVADGGRNAQIETVTAPDGRSYRAAAFRVGRDRIAFVATDVTGRTQAERALRASEALYRGALHALRDGILVLDATGAVVAASASAARIVGTSTRDLVGGAATDPRWDARAEDGTPVPAHAHPVTVVLRTGDRVRDVLLDVARPDGERVWLLLNVEPLRDGDGPVSGAMVTMQDVTRSRRTEQALLTSEARYSTTLDNLAEGAQILDSGWRWVYLNRTAARHRGGELIDAVGRSLFDTYPGFETTPIFARFRRCMETGEPQQFEASHTFADGTTEWFDFRVHAVPEGIFVLSIEVTDRHEARVAMAAREEELRRATDALEEARHIAGLGVWKRDLRTRTVEWSPEIYRLYGLDPSRPPTWEEAESALDTRTLTRRQDAIERGASSGEPWELEAAVRRPDGVVAWAWVRGVTEVDAEGTPIGAHGIAMDITIRKRAEMVVREFSAELERRVAARTAALEAANEDLRSFTYSVSHDLRAPVRSIAGFARLLELRNAGQLDEEGVHRLHNIVTAGENMGRVIDDLLAYSRIGRGAVRAEAVALASVLEVVTTSCASLLETTGGSIVVREPLAVPLADPTLVENVLLNLLQNALVYHRDGVAPAVEVSAIEAGTHVAISISDNGMGIPADALERIFEPFYRLANDESRPGTGIGLAIVRRSVAAMDGEISVTSAPGLGTTFQVVLPSA